jgi:hypothetical protein
MQETSQPYLLHLVYECWDINTCDQNLKIRKSKVGITIEYSLRKLTLPP